jgi:hypothetical protein
MVLIIREEKNTYKNIVRIRDEDWGFDSISELRACEDFLNKYFINYSVSYSFEVYHIIIQDSTWEHEISKHYDPKLLEDFDNSFINFLSSLVSWKIKGSRPKSVEKIDINDYIIENE